MERQGNCNEAHEKAQCCDGSRFQSSTLSIDHVSHPGFVRVRKEYSSSSVERPRGALELRRGNPERQDPRDLVELFRDDVPPHPTSTFFAFDETGFGKNPGVV